MKIVEALQEATQILENQNIADAKLDAWYLLSFVTKLTRDRYFLEQRADLEDDKLAYYRELVKKRANHIPLQHITGEQDFMGFTFKVNEHVLVPRQDTETLVEEALKLVKPNSRVLDMCTGSGCVIISILAKSDSTTGVGADISSDALSVASENATRILGRELEFVQTDLFEKISGSFDYIVSNPPYIRSSDINELEIEVKEHEPMIALDGFDDGLYFYKKITAQAFAYLNKGGWLLFEIGYDQGADVSLLMREAGYLDVQIVKDLAGHDRVVKGHL